MQDPLKEALTALNANQPQRVVQLCDRLLSQKQHPKHGEILLLRGVAALRLKEGDAEHWLQAAWAAKAEGAALQLGRYQMQQGRLREALAVLQGDRDPLARLLAADILFKLGELDTAAQAFAKELDTLPRQAMLVPFWIRRASLAQQRKKSLEAIRCYEEILLLEPNNLDARANLARCYTALNRPQDTIALLKDQQHFGFRWLDARAVPVVYRDQVEISFYRQRYRQSLEHLNAMPLDQAGAVAALEMMSGGFFTHYACEDDRPNQELLGGIIHRVVHTAYPAFSAPLALRGPHEKIRVGFASSFFNFHTVSRLFEGWILGLDRQRFEVCIYPLGAPDDHCRQLCAAASRSLPLSGKLERDAQMLRAEALDVLIYPELGMDIRTLRLAAVRCAPHQAVAWGHPVTTGLPTIDTFLSAESMEPEGAAGHYSEKLFCLPHLSISLPKPPVRPRRKSELGIPEGCFLVFCTQNLIKLLPRHDFIFAQLAKRIPKLLLVFVGVEGVVGEAVFRERIQAAFMAEGLDIQQHIAFFPKVSHASFLELNQAADIFLDGLAWSGGMTTLEAVAAGLVPVCTEGPWMRTRHTAAIVRQLGMPEQVAETPEGVVDIIVRLAEDPEYLQGQRQRVRAAASRLWEDPAPVRALESWLLDVTHGGFHA